MTPPPTGRTERRARGAAVACAVALALLLAMPVPAFAEEGREGASAAPAAPAPALLTVTGTITGLDLLPRGTVRAALIRLPYRDEQAGPVVRLDPATGAFSASGLAPGVYALRVLVASAEYPSSAAVSAQLASVGGATAFELSASSSPVRAAVQRSEATVSGSLSFSGADVRDGWYAVADLYQRAGDSWVWVNRGDVDAGTLRYRTGSVAAGEYAMRFIGGNPCMIPDLAPGTDASVLEDFACGFHDEWWKGAPAPQTASTIALSAGQQRDGIDGTLGAEYIDVARDRKFAGDIAWMYEAGISTGVSGPNGNIYQPRLAVSREAMAAFLYRLAGRPAFPAPAAPSFADVPKSHRFFREIEWMKRQGLTTGIRTADGVVFGAKRSVSREAMAAFLYRYAGRPAVDPAAAKRFVDVAPGQPFAREIAWMSATGITTGVRTPAGLAYRPKSPVKRDAMAAFMHRASTRL